MAPPINGRFLEGKGVRKTFCKRLPKTCVFGSLLLVNRTVRKTVDWRCFCRIIRFLAGKRLRLDCKCWLEAMTALFDQLGLPTFSAARPQGTSSRERKSACKVARGARMPPRVAGLGSPLFLNAEARGLLSLAEDVQPRGEAVHAQVSGAHRRPAHLVPE